MRILLLWLCCLNFTLQAKVNVPEEKLYQLTKEEGLILLAESGYKPFYITNAGDSILHTAVRKEDILAIKISLDCGFDAHSTNLVGDTPLHIAAEKGFFNIVSFLIESGSSLDSKNALGQTPYHKALIKNNIELTTLFIEKGYVCSDEITDYLIATGFNPLIKNNQGNTPLHKAASENNNEMIKILIENGYDIDAPNNAGKTPLMLSITKGHQDTSILLIELGANINSVDFQGNGALMSSIAKKAQYILTVLCESQNIWLNIANEKGISPIHFAVACGDTFALNQLLKNGASVNELTEPSEYWSETENWSRNDFEAWDEYGGSGASYIRRGYLTPIVSPLAIAMIMHPENTVIIELLESYGGEYEFTPAISKFRGIPPVSLEKYLGF